MLSYYTREILSYPEASVSMSHSIPSDHRLRACHWWLCWPETWHATASGFYESLTVVDSLTYSTSIKGACYAQSTTTSMTRCVVRLCKNIVLALSQLIRLDFSNIDLNTYTRKWLRAMSLIFALHGNTCIAQLSLIDCRNHKRQNNVTTLYRP